MIFYTFFVTSFVILIICLWTNDFLINLCAFITTTNNFDVFYFIFIITFLPTAKLNYIHVYLC